MIVPKKRSKSTWKKAILEKDCADYEEQQWAYAQDKARINGNREQRIFKPQRAFEVSKRMKTGTNSYEYINKKDHVERSFNKAVHRDLLFSTLDRCTV